MPQSHRTKCVYTLFGPVTGPFTFKKAGREVENMNIWKKVLSVGLSLAMCAGMVMPAFAAVEYDIALGDVNVAQNDDGQTISWSAGHETYKDEASAAVDNEIVVKQSDAETATQNTINVTGAAEGTTVVLSGVNIDVSDTDKAAMSISGEETDVTVELDGENTLKSGLYRAGLELNKGASVTIQDDDEDGGTLDATGGYFGAGIGGAWNGSFGDVVIKSGTVNATAIGTYIDAGRFGCGAGIGCGAAKSFGNLVKIEGGTVNAQSTYGRGGSGIGGGYAGAGVGGIKNIEISGGTVTAKGHVHAIGSGEYGTTPNIKITGGVITLLAKDIGPSTPDSIITDTASVLMLAGGFPNTNNAKLSDGQHFLKAQFNWREFTDNTTTSFVLINSHGQVVREFDMSMNGTKYNSLAINLPDGEDYYLLQKGENGTFIQHRPGSTKYWTNQVAFTIGSDLAPQYLKPASAKVNYTFVSGTEDTELPPEITDLLKNGFETTFDDVPDDGGKWTFKGWNIGIPEIKDGKLQDVDAVGTWVYAANPPAPEPPSSPNGPNGFDGYDFDGGTTTIENEAVPLAAGPVTRAEFLDYLWRHEGQPANDGVCTFTDVEDDHEYILALAWAEQTGIAEAYDDGTFLPDELVTVAAVREFLSNFAEVFGLEVEVDDLATLTGEDDEAVLNCDEVIAEFFGEELFSKEEAA